MVFMQYSFQAASNDLSFGHRIRRILQALHGDENNVLIADALLTAHFFTMNTEENGETPIIDGAGDRLL